MRAISNFKALLSSRSRLNSPRINLSPFDAASPNLPSHMPRFARHKPKPSMDEQEFAELKRANEEHAARLLEERKRVLRSRGGDAQGGPLGHVLPDTDDEHPAEPPLEEAAPRDHGDPPSKWTTPPVLGIGTGGQPNFPAHLATSPYEIPPPSGVVADSPTAVDFDVYDRAYGEEIERIKQSGGRPSVYMTWHVGDKERIRGEEDVDVVDDRHGSGNVEDGKESRHGVNRMGRFADLVAQTIKDTKERALDSKDEGEDAPEE